MNRPEIELYYKLSGAILDRTFSNPLTRGILADLELIWQMNGASTPSREFQIFGIDKCSPQLYFLVKRVRDEPVKSIPLIRVLLPEPIAAALQQLWSETSHS